MGLVVCVLYYRLRAKDNSFIWMAILCLFTMIPTHPQTVPPLYSGRVIEVKENSFTIRQNNHIFSLYTVQELPFDAEITFDGEFQKMQSSLHLFQPNFQANNALKGIHYAIYPKTVRIRKEHLSFRNFLYRRIQNITDPYYRKITGKILLGITDSSVDSFLLQSGFSLTGLLFTIEYFLQFVTYHAKKITFALGIVLFVLYGFPLVLFQAILIKGLRFTKLKRDQILGFGMIITLTLYPAAYTSMAFLIPCVFRLSQFTKEKKLISFYGNMLIQGIFLHEIHPLMSLLFPYVRFTLGLTYCIAFISVIIHVESMMIGIVWIEKVLSLTRMFTLYGSLIGFGTIVYGFVVAGLRKKKYFLQYAVALLVIFQMFGMFHPFAEVTFINVGQGDSILIKKPFNQPAMLIDTGKPSQKNNVTHFLHAKGITKLHTLVITHADNDHSGNKDSIIRTFHPTQTVESHQAIIYDGKYTYYDLNPLVTNDENQSSLVLYTQINHLKYLFMGDADEVSEKAIIDNFQALSTDILKLSHHGSKTGSSDAFLDTVRPSLAIISSGAYRIYHHPSPEVIQKLLKRHIPYLDTKEEGDITIFHLFGFNILFTASNKIGLI